MLCHFLGFCSAQLVLHYQRHSTLGQPDHPIHLRGFFQQLSLISIRQVGTGLGDPRPFAKLPHTQYWWQGASVHSETTSTFLQV